MIDSKMLSCFYQVKKWQVLLVTRGIENRVQFCFNLIMSFKSMD